MVSPVLFESRRDDWATPRWLFAQLDAEFGFTLDPCASLENAKCPRFYTRAEDGLAQPWWGSVFVNPPYGKEVEYWIRKAHESAMMGATVVCLLPARTDTAWFHRWVLPHASELHFFRGRIRFAGAQNSAPFPSILAVFRPVQKQQTPEAALLLVKSISATPPRSTEERAAPFTDVTAAARAAKTTKAASRFGCDGGLLSVPASRSRSQQTARPPELGSRIRYRAYPSPASSDAPLHSPSTANPTSP